MYELAGRSYLSVANQISTFDILENVHVEVTVDFGFANKSTEIKVADLNYSTLGISAYLIPYKNQWKVLSSNISPYDLPDLSDPICDTFGTDEEFKSRIYDNSQKLLDGIKDAINVVNFVKNITSFLKKAENFEELNTNPNNGNVKLADKYSKQRPKFRKGSKRFGKRQKMKMVKFTTRIQERN